MTTLIVGAGMAGLLAGCMLRDHIIIEQKTSLPNNHQAVLRFRTRAVAEALNIPFKSVKMMKCVQQWKNPVADQLSYSWKANGTAQLRSSVSANGEVAERFIAPPDLISQMAKMCIIDYGRGLTDDFCSAWLNKTIISTIPMPALMTFLGWEEKPEFKSRSGWVIRLRLREVDAYCSVYDPDPLSPVTRASITGDLMIIEMGTLTSSSDAISRASELLGVPEFCILPGQDEAPVSQQYAKILPIDENARKRFIIWATEKFNIYSLGRFATWRPGLLLDDVVNDVRVIQRLMNGGSSYHHKKG